MSPMQCKSINYINTCLSIAIKGPIIRGAVTRENEGVVGEVNVTACLARMDVMVCKAETGGIGRDGMQVEHLVLWDHLDHLVRMGED